MPEAPLCSPPDRHPRRARFVAPEGTTDCHTHVFEAQYPLSPRRGYTPPDSNLADMQAMHSRLGVDRVVLVQPSVYGIDNSAILDAMARMSGSARAVVAIDLRVSDERLADLDRLGVRGVRLNMADPGGMPVSMGEVATLAERISQFGWHLEFLFEPSELTDLVPLMAALPVPVSIGHFGYVNAAAGVDSAPFRLLLELVEAGNTWIKLSAPYRLGVGDLPPWDEIVSLARALVAVRADRMLWATDWPHPNKFGQIPNDADLIDEFARWVPEPDVQRTILVDNPAALYRF